VPYDERVARATAIYRKLIAGRTAGSGLAWNGLATWKLCRRASGVFYYQKSIAAEPDFTLGYFALGFLEPRLATMRRLCPPRERRKACSTAAMFPTSIQHNCH